MYKLLLTSDDRSAIDWIGDRYEHGDTLRGYLTECEMVIDDVEADKIDWDALEEDDRDPLAAWVEATSDEIIDWSDDYDIVFFVPEHLAWAINKIIDDGNLDCFAIELVGKLLDFADSVV